MACRGPGGGCRGRLGAWVEAGWAFVTLGVALTISAFLLGVVYFSIRTLTTSLELVDIVPTYATALLLCCVGILTMFMYKRRDPFIAVPTLVLSLVSLLLNSASLILVGTKVIWAMHHFRSCRYNHVTRQCHCYTQIGDPDLSELVYKDAPSCSAIETTLLQLAYSQCSLFAVDLVLCGLTVGLTAFTIHRDRRVHYLLEEEDDLVDPELETLRADNLTDPLIGQYRQLMSRQITLPDFRYGCETYLSPDFQSGSLRSATGVPGGGNNNVTTNVVQESGEAPNPTNSFMYEQLQSRDTPGRVVPMLPTDGTYTIGGLAHLTRPFNSTRRGIGGRQSRWGVAQTPHELFWDGYCRRPEDEVGDAAADGSADAAGSGPPARRVNRSQSLQSHSDGGQWSLQPLLLAADGGNTSRAPLRGVRPRRRSPRERTRSRRRTERHQPYVAFVPIPYSMYRPSSLLGLGISPFPMEPPPPYSSSVEPPPYTGNSPAPEYTSRATSPARPNPRENIYENVGAENSNILLQTRI